MIVSQNGQKEIMPLAGAICQSVSQTGVSEIGILDHDMDPKMKAGSMLQVWYFPFLTCLNLKLSKADIFQHLF